MEAWDRSPKLDDALGTSSGDNAPTCGQCGYILLGLTEHRCPECGTPFDPEEVRTRHLLLPWERPRYGRPGRRFVRTLLCFCAMPFRRFRPLADRIDRPIGRVGQLGRRFVRTVLCFWATHRRFVRTLLCFWGMPFRRFRPLAYRPDRPIGRVRQLLVLLLIALALVLAIATPLRMLQISIWVTQRAWQDPDIHFSSFYEIFHASMGRWRSHLSRFVHSYPSLVGYAAGAAGVLAWRYRRRRGTRSFPSLLAVFLSFGLLVCMLDFLLWTAAWAACVVADANIAPLHSVAKWLSRAVMALYVPIVAWGILRALAGESRRKSAAVTLAAWIGAVITKCLTSLIAELSWNLLAR